MTLPEPLYDPAKFREGARVEIADRPGLDEFLKTWSLHHKLQPEQLDHAGKIVRVERLFMYHGGDIIYQLESIPGLWHERCLKAV